MKPTLRAVEMLRQEGFERIGIFLGGQILGLPRGKDDEYVRFFAPQVITSRGGSALVGVIGSMEVEALKNWKQIDRISEWFVISLFSANFPSLRSPPILGVSDEEDRAWCRSIAKIAYHFPANYVQLEKLLAEKGEIAGVAIDRFDG
jgi:hypothetical protein